VQTGIYAVAATRAPKDMRGLTFPVEFEIIDKLDSPEAVAAAKASPDKAAGAEFKKPNAPYVVKILLTVRAPCSRYGACALINRTTTM
jgi:hypothetical protein